MPLQNRVQPNGDILAITARGTLMGNRGILHTPDQTLGTSRWTHKAWVCCRLSFKNRKRRVMAPHTYTELFFHDEAVAMAAGHRPCAECRRPDFLTFKTAFETAVGRALLAPEIDNILHASRVRRNRQQVTYTAAPNTLPDGTFIVQNGQPHLLMNGAIAPYAPLGYGAPRTMPTAPVDVLTPRATVAAMQAGYHPIIDPGLVSQFS